MEKKKFSCPNCGTPVPKSKALFMTNFTKVTCKECGTKMRPNSKILFIIGAVGITVAAGIGFLIGLFASDSGEWTFGFYYLLLLIVTLALISSFFTIRYTDFREVTVKK